MATPDVVAIIPARGGSKELPRKNLRPLGGKPLIDWTLEAALAARSISAILLSSDDEEILQRAQDERITRIERPSALAQDHTSQVEVALHALDRMESDPEILVLLQPTSPLRTNRDIEDAVTTLRESTADAVVAVTRARTHPFLTRRADEEGWLRKFIDGEGSTPRRQELPAVWELNGAIYACRTPAFRRERTFEPSRTLPYVMPQDRSVDIDSGVDLALAETLLPKQ